MTNQLLFFATTESSALGTIWDFFSNGGLFMFPIIACSLVAVTVTVYKILSVKAESIIPKSLLNSLGSLESDIEKHGVVSLASKFSEENSSLERLCKVALSNADRSQVEIQEAVQSAAREEIVKMNSGMAVLEVVIAIAPLIGLLGTASGLVIVFANVGNGADSSSVGQGIAMALNTTVAGLAVAVPTVVAHSHFNRKIETISARLEVIMGDVTSACYQYMFRQNG